MLAANTRHPLEDIQASFQIGERWYVFHAEPSAEKRASLAIRDLGFTVFVPFERHIRRKPGRKPRTFERAYFSGYGFVRFDINNRDWGRILAADGVLDVLRSVGVPRAVPDAAVDALKVAESIGALDKTKPPKEGVEVEVAEGPFRDLIGKVLRARSGDRADVLFKGIFGGDRMITLPLAFLKEAG